MAFLNRGQSPVNTTPHLRRKLKNNPLKMLLKLVMVPLISLGFLWWFGGPALLTTYQYHGSRENPMMTRCDYLTLQGWHVVTPGYGINQCPGLTLLPFDLQSFLEVLL